ncbi:MAG: nickel-responsive transcriptional regulator NikR [Methanocellales archaeon]|nr:nickel-responsive transcriptional regulator NikR [Methanocellales archaeon]MDD3290983.1 nickel-responsive transcriptional regulator NikR [Methanocellales archaeon]MDD5234868.1 nickel-responsive transcriptional regulator NikR [Methanocellales archaeon]MDD5484762.1 nickel-responsive transcriptional regulator NikR [Methanocellales archaeon]
MKKGLMRIGVSLPANLLGRFDEIISLRGYSSRSEGIRDAIRNYIVDYEWMSQQKGDRVGTITLIFDHSQRGLVDELTDIEHDYSNLIESSLHVHLDERNCLEVILVRGESQEVKNIVEKMMALKGVKHVKLTTTSPGEGL